jgi:PKD repeat protein
VAFLDTFGTTGATGEFNGSLSYDPDGEIVSYFWDFGDKTTASGMIVEKTYTKARTFMVTLEVTDDKGLSNSTSFDVTVVKKSRLDWGFRQTNERPIAKFTISDPPYPVFDAVRVDASASSDPDGGAIRGYACWWGDGTYSITNSPVAEHVYADVGTFTIWLWAFDNEYHQGRSWKDITIEPLPKKKWNFMVYIAADNNLHQFVQRRINKMEHVGSDDNFSILVQADLNGRNDTARYYVQKDPNNKMTDDDPISGSLLRQIREVNTGEPKSLTDFVNWAGRVSPAERYALIISGHGWGWKGVAVDDTSGKDWLYMGELSTALNLVGVPLDIIAFEACLMGMIEVGYQIKYKAKIMVASEEIMCANDGFPYHEILGALKVVPPYTAKELASSFVYDYANFYETKKYRGRKFERYTLSAINLDKSFDDLVQQTSRLGEQLGKGSSSIAEDGGMEDYNKLFRKHYEPDDNVQICIRDNLIETEHFGKPGNVPGCGDANFIDLYDFAIEILGDDRIHERWKGAAEDIRQSLHLFGPVIHKEFHGSLHNWARGLSIYFPSAQTKFPAPFPKKNVCTKQPRRAHSEMPFDVPIPSCKTDRASGVTTYAEDKTIEWGKAPYRAPPPHPLPETPGFDFPQDTEWDEFLHRYYKPVADAGGDWISGCDPGAGVTITFDGSGSSDSDGNITEYIWDFYDFVSDDSEDCDKDEKPGEKNDDRNATGKEITRTFFNPGIYNVTLTVLDDHQKYGKDLLKHKHDKHYKTDQDTALVIIDCGPPENEEGYPQVVHIPGPNHYVDGINHDGEFPVTIRDKVFDPLCATGELHEPLGRIMRVEVRVDGVVIFQQDDINEPVYEFEFAVNLSPEMHILTIHAWDWVGKHMEKPVEIIYVLEGLWVVKLRR